ncbi:MAG: bifunctional metallophosphatase/5'-nucleotidase [Bacteroides sp.]|nr:bifunctional metallophosphatase/5'-nucleotidase [Bacteroides sp.]MBD5290367.1 bifunctional metallophosphatase/5'-nucleotidase [Bacteroides sp.]MBD5307392.1 bifunctional metallophosphatase/5'-nucleotidase [Bacteroides sp.]
MKKIISLMVAAVSAAAIMLFPQLTMAEKLVIVHSNDTHSLIDPDASGAGGILQRKAVIDSIRRVEKNLTVVDAGDGVQGSLYFKFFRGAVDYPLMDQIGYDIRILGNHEFDNGLDELAQAWKKVKGAKLSANYDFSDTPAKGIFEPYVIRKIGGKKVGFIGLNINPESLIAENNYRGMRFSDPIQTADSLAALLKKKKGCDLVVAVTHIGYRMAEGEASDILLASRSEDIDVIIGGHTHTLVNPATPEQTPFIIPNANGKPVLVTQVGKSGKYLGKITIDTDLLDKGKRSEAFSYELIPVTDRFADSQLDPKMKEILAPFKARVDSINARRIATVRTPMDGNAQTGAFPNWSADFGLWYGNLKADSLRSAGNIIPPVDLAIMNVGGIRSSWDAGALTEGKVLETFPFSNNFVIIELKGSDLAEVFRVAAAKGGEAVSDGVLVITDGNGNYLDAMVNGKPLDPERTYTVGTINYLAWGNDGLRALANGKWLFKDDVEVSAPYLRYIDLLDSMGLPIEGESDSRFVVSVHDR